VPRTKRAEPPGADHGGRTREASRTLNPGYFALVMASAIVSIAMRNHHAYAISVLLMWVAGVTYTVLVVLHAWRLLAFRAAMAVDLADPGLGFGFSPSSPAQTYSAPGSPRRTPSRRGCPARGWLAYVASGSDGKNGLPLPEQVIPAVIVPDGTVLAGATVLASTRLLSMIGGTILSFYDW
jgi:Voltage-dependent anion channel